MKKIALSIFSIVIFSAGVLLGLALVFSATWADVESVFYGFNRFGNKPASTFHCPILITGDENGVVSATFKNTTSQRIRPSVRFQASSQTVFRTESATLSIEPGQSETLRWEVNKNDLALNHFIFAKVFTFASYPEKNVEQTCGIVVLDLPGLPGKTWSILIVIGSLLGMAVGCLLWPQVHKPLKYRSLDALRAMLTLTITVVAGMLTVLFALWPLGILLSALSLILIGVIVGEFVQVEKS